MTTCALPQPSEHLNLFRLLILELPLSTFRETRGGRNSVPVLAGNLGPQMAIMPAHLADRVGNEAGLLTREALSNYLSKRRGIVVVGARYRQ
jgi:hypothetical protein